jgi:hypothetical protein
MPKARFWHSQSMTQKIANSGFDIIQVLADAKRPRSVTDLLSELRWSRLSSGRVIDALLLLHKTSNIEGFRNDKVSRARLSGDRTRVSLTSAGRQLLKQSQSRQEFTQRILGTS